MLTRKFIGYVKTLGVFNKEKFIINKKIPAYNNDIIAE